MCIRWNYHPSKLHHLHEIMNWTWKHLGMVQKNQNHQVVNTVFGGTKQWNQMLSDDNLSGIPLGDFPSSTWLRQGVDKSYNTWNFKDKNGQVGMEEVETFSQWSFLPANDRRVSLQTEVSDDHHVTLTIIDGAFINIKTLENQFNVKAYLNLDIPCMPGKLVVSLTCVQWLQSCKTSIM